MPDRIGTSALARLERVAGIEPAYSAWKAAALPLCYTRLRLLALGEEGSGGQARTGSAEMPGGEGTPRTAFEILLKGDGLRIVAKRQISYKRQGANLAVCLDLPELCSQRR